MSWNYAELSKLAKRYGGPEKLLEVVKAAARKTGRKEMMPLVCIAFLMGVGVTKGSEKLNGFIKDRKRQSDEAEKAAKAAEIELIRGIRNYDLEHPEQEEDKADVEVEDTEAAESKDQGTYIEEEDPDGDGELAEEDSADQGTPSEERESDSDDEMTMEAETKHQDMQTEEGN